MTSHSLILTSGFALLAGVFVLPLLDDAYWAHIVIGCIAVLSLVALAGVRRGRTWSPRYYQ